MLWKPPGVYQHHLAGGSGRITRTIRKVKILRMTQTPDSQLNYIDNLIAGLRDKAISLPQSTATNYLKALTAFESFTAIYPHDISAVSREMLADWYVNMIISGHTRKTALHYINSLSALYSSLKGKDETSDDEFAWIKDKIKKLSPDMPDCRIDSVSFERLLQLIRTIERLQPDLKLTASLLTLALLNPSISLSEIAYLDKDTTDRLTDTSAEIANTYSTPRRKYIFPLSQSQVTNKQVLARLDSSLLSLMRSRNITVFTTAEATIQSYWAYATIAAGATPCEAVSALGHTPPGIPALTVCPRKNSSRPLPDIEPILLSNPLCWHAMRLRPGVRFESLTSRLHALPFTAPQLFYPSVEIARRIGKKLTYCNQPLIADIVFFRSRITDIPRIFRHIGDIAWCYRRPTDTGSPYATIPDSAMLEFQTAIGIFSPDMDLYPIGTIDLRPDDIVEVIGDMFMGHKGRIESIKTPTVYRLILWGNNGLEWRADIDSRLLRKVTSLPHPTVA